MNLLVNLETSKTISGKAKNITNYYQKAGCMILVNQNTIETYKSLQAKSLRFAIFWEIFENCQLKTLRKKAFRFFDTISVTIYPVIVKI